MIAPHILILAAGASRRMRGADKLTEQVEGHPLLRQTALRALELKIPVTVALNADHPARAQALRDLPLTRVTVPNPQDGMAASLTAGLRAVPDDAALLLLLADLPDLTAADLARMLAEMQATPDLILRGTAEDGTPGHPVCFPPWARAELMSLTGDAGAREVLTRHKDRLRLVALPGRHAITDLDTPEDWARWRDLHRQ